MMDDALRNLHCNDEQTRRFARMTRSKKREEVLRKYERIMERIAEENAKSD